MTKRSTGGRCAERCCAAVNAHRTITAPATYSGVRIWPRASQPRAVATTGLSSPSRVTSVTGRAPARSGEQSTAVALGHRRGSITSAEFVVDVLQMGLDARFADEQRRSGLSI